VCNMFHTTDQIRFSRQRRKCGVLQVVCIKKHKVAAALNRSLTRADVWITRNDDDFGFDNSGACSGPGSRTPGRGLSSLNGLDFDKNPRPNRSWVFYWPAPATPFIVKE
jgi:hypothetical protein